MNNGDLQSSGISKLLALCEKTEVGTKSALQKL